ncbi:MAG: purine-nucleoside phosphorylase [Planctomycetes bacterium]|jgi:purine-nucleoside phosphorylase|nr:purine-nucleoside phosphorylase [Planctomycetota bacterium]
MDTIRRAAEAVAARAPRRPEAAVVLGSGLSGIADRVEGAIEIPYRDVPHFPLPSVAGHEGALVLGRLRGRDVALLRGRVHFYEGVPLSQVAFPVRVLALLGVRTLVLTNAAGAVAGRLRAGDLMLISDHLNLLGASPLAGPNLDAIGPRFPDMSEVYDAGLRDLARRCAGRLGIPLAEGVYAAMPGPSYETPAEVRMLRTLGADAVGMSTVPEAVAARHAGIRVLGFSMISNLAAGLSARPLSHEEVLATGAEAGKRLGALIEEVVGGL